MELLVVIDPILTNVNRLQEFSVRTPCGNFDVLYINMNIEHSGVEYIA